jgi:5-deoxy-glucuronate isomerase
MTRLADCFDADTTGEVSLVCAATPASAGWRYLTSAVVDLGPGAELMVRSAGRELGITGLAGDVRATTGDIDVRLQRDDVFIQRGSVLYVPPDSEVRLHAGAPSSVSIGGAPADPVYPARYFDAGAMRSELRGGGAALRQVTHLLSPPMEAHRLIMYEVHVPRGSWSGWPPHCHDGEDGSPYLEETYYFEHKPSNGFGIHRNFREARGLDDVFVAPHRSLVTVPAGYHSSAASPGSHMYFLNYLAGDLEHGDRRTPPCFDERYTWIDGHWDDDPMTLPMSG